MVMEPNQPTDGSQIQQPNSSLPQPGGNNQQMKMDSQPPPEAGNMQPRAFPPMSYPEGGGMMPPSSNADQAQYSQSPMMQQHQGNAAASTQQSTATPTLNQLLTQNPGTPRYPGQPGYGGSGEFPGSGNPGQQAPQNMYDGWNNQPQQNASNPAAMYPGHMGQMRPGIPPNRAMVPPGMQMPAGGPPTGGMYDRPDQAMPPNYRQPSGGQYGMVPGGPGYRMMGPNQHGSYPQASMNPAAADSAQANANDGSEGSDMQHVNPAQMRSRHPMMGPSRMMGPPRVPGTHPMDPSGNPMMPPPNQNQSYPSMHPYSGGQPYRNQQMPPYGNYQNNPMSQMPGQANFPQGPMNQQPMSPQVNGPQHKAMPPSPGQAMNQSSPGVRGLSPAPNQSNNLVPSPAPSTGHAKAMSPCPSPAQSSHRSLPPSPSPSQQNMNSPRPGLSPRPESVASPRTDIQKPPGSHLEQQRSSIIPSASLPQTNAPAVAQISSQPSLSQAAAVTQQMNPTAISSLPNAVNNPQMAAMQHGQPLPPNQQPGQMPMHTAGSHQGMPNSMNSQSINQPGMAVGPPSQQPGMPAQMGQPGIPPQQPGMMPQPRMFPPGHVPNSNQQMGGPPNQQQMTMGNGMPAGYQQRMPGPGQPPHFQQQNRMPGPYPGGQFPPHNQQGFPQNNQGAGGMFPIKNTANSATPNAVRSPLSAAQSPAAVGSPHGSGGSTSRRASGRKDSSSSKTKANKPVPPNTIHGTSMDVFNKQLELGPEPMRRQFLEHLCQFYLETSKPLMSNPTIGKNPFDLYKVYALVKEKGGFQETCKKKMWKQVGTASSSSTAANAAYTLKKAYTKYLLNYECRFDRGGIDPQVVLSAVDTKKDRNRNAPSPGSSSNSQEATMRGGYPDYNNMAGVPHGHPHMRMGSQFHPGADPNMPPHQQQGDYMNYNNMGGPPQAGMPNGHHHMQGGMGGTDDQNMMPNRSDQNPDAFRQQQMGGQFNNQQQMGAPGYPARHPYYGPRMPGPQRPPFSQHQQGLPGQQHPGSNGSPMMPQPNSASGPGFGFSRPTPGYQNSQTGPTNTGSGTDYPAGYYPRPSLAGTASSQYNPMKSSMGPGGVPGSANSGIPTASTPSGPPMGRFGPRPGYPPNTPRGALSAMLSNSAGSNSSNAEVPHLQNQAPLPGSFTESLAWGSEGSLEMPPPPLPVSVGEPSSKSSHTTGRGFPYPQKSAAGPWDRQKYPPGQSPFSGEPHPKMKSLHKVLAPPPKKEIVFPPGSVESQKAVKVKRKVLHSKDVGKIDPWKLVMCLKSGQLCESIWALDTITILLHDDSSLMFFTLKKMPGLLDVLLAHYKQTLALMFEECSDLVDLEPKYTTSHSLDHEDQDLETKQTVLTKANFSWSTRNGMKVIIDSDLKAGHMIPSPSMYNRKDYISSQTDCKVVTIHESDTQREFYTKQCTRHVKPDKKQRSSSIVSSEDDDIIMNSPIPTSPTSGGTTATVSSAPTERRLIPEGSSIGQFPMCNGCIHGTGDLKSSVQLHSEHSCESTDIVMSSAESTASQPTKASLSAAGESEMSQVKKEMADEEARFKEMDKSFELEALEAKLKLSRKRRFSENIDNEPVIRDSSCLEPNINNRMDEIGTRCITLANIFRSLSFLPANEQILAEHKGLLDIFGRVLNLRLIVDSSKDKRERWWGVLETLRVHTLVCMSNISGHVKLINVAHQICYPVLDGLLFWATTTAAYARDPIPHTHSLTIQNLVMEIFCKMCAHSENINLLLATPPMDRIVQLFQKLSKLLTETDQVRREFALVIVSTLAQADPVAARGLAVQPSCVSQLISILESAESAAFNIAQSRGVAALRQNPEAMGTSLDMIRRTSATLVEMAQVKENHSILMRQQDRLLNLVMSQILDQHVAKMLSDVLYECTKSTHYDISDSFIITKSTGREAEETEMSEDEPDLSEDAATNSAVAEDEPSAADDNASVMKNHTDGEIPRNSTSVGEHDKENIEKSTLKCTANSSMEVISAAS